MIIGQRFVIRKLIGRGGMGNVMLALDQLTGEEVAIKHLKPDMVSAIPNALERFMREGEVLRKLEHPNIVKVLMTLTEGDDHYIVMEYVRGGSLQDLLARQGRLPARHMVEIGLELADALARVHHLGILHRDLKPANVLLTEKGSPRLSDFGLAMVIDTNRLTDAGTLLGTYPYLSPETCLGEEVAPRSDLWALGVMFYEMLTGSNPFRRESVYAAVQAILSYSVPPIYPQQKDVPASLSALIERLLIKDPQQRLGSARLLGAELEHILLNWNKPTVELTTANVGERTSMSSAFHLFHNLVFPMTSFVGRKKEIETLWQWLQQPTNRLVTLTGPGGVGKTRLAREVARQMLSFFTEGVIEISLALLQDAEEVLPTLAQTLRISEKGDLPLLELVKQYLQPRKMLLLFDNFEHLLPASTLIATLIESCPYIEFLVTSQSRLMIYGEQEFPVPPLAVPTLPETRYSSSKIHDLAALSAIELFVQRAQAVKPDFRLTAENAGTIAQICTQLDGLPLALELAAARIKMFPPVALLQRLQNRLRFLVGRDTNRPSRHQTLRAAIEWSYQLLDEPDKLVFAQLGVFAGTFPIEAVEAILGPETLTNLESLVEKSLINPISTPQGELWFSLLAVIRDFATEQLKQQGQSQTFRQRHADYFAKFIQESSEQVGKTEQKLWMQRTDSHYANILSMLDWFLLESSDQGAKDAGIHCLFDLHPYWINRGRYSEGSYWITKAENSYPATPIATQVRYLNLCAFYAQQKGDFAKANTILLENLEKSRLLGDPFLTSRTLGHIGLSMGRAGNYTEAYNYLSEALEMERTFAKEPLQLSVLLNNLAMASQQLGDLAQTQALLQESLTLKQSRGDQIGVATSLANLGNVALSQNNYPEAIQYHRQSLLIRQDQKDLTGMNQSLFNCGRLAALLNKPFVAATLMAFTTQFRQKHQFAPSTDENKSEQQTLDLVRSQLSPPLFEEAQKSGQGMSLEEAVTFALAELETPNP